MSLPGVLPDALRASLTTLGSLPPQVDRCLPVDEALGSLFPYGGLVRGQVVGFGGEAGISLAIAAVSQTISQGSWMAVVGFDDFGVEAAGELGVPLERVVRIDGGRSSLDWADRVAACADGFDVVMVASMPAAGLMRRVRQRLQARGSILIVVDPSHLASSRGEGSGRSDAAHGCDTYLTASESRWVGVGSGHGAILARMVTVQVSGRRVAARRAAEGMGGHRVWLPSPTGEIQAVTDGSADHHRMVS